MDDEYDPHAYYLDAAKARAAGVPHMAEDPRRAENHPFGAHQFDNDSDGSSQTASTEERKQKEKERHQKNKVTPVGWSIGNEHLESRAYEYLSQTQKQNPLRGKQFMVDMLKDIVDNDITVVDIVGEDCADEEVVKRANVILGDLRSKPFTQILKWELTVAVTFSLAIFDLCKVTHVLKPALNKLVEVCVDAGRVPTPLLKARRIQQVRLANTTNHMYTGTASPELFKEYLDALQVHGIHPSTIVKDPDFPLCGELTAKQLASKFVGYHQSLIGANLEGMVASGIAPDTSLNWTEKENQLFVDGVEQFGVGNWMAISKVVKTRTNKQVKVHAQKIFEKPKETEEDSMMIEDETEEEGTMNQEDVTNQEDANQEHTTNQIAEV